jgi:hypothetical protein
LTFAVDRDITVALEAFGLILADALNVNPSQCAEAVRKKGEQQ